jgi:hypothetical protein
MSEIKDGLLKFVETIREGALFFSYDVFDKKDYVRGRIDCTGGQPVFFASRIGLDIEELTELVEKIIELQKECQKEQEGA